MNDGHPIRDLGLEKPGVNIAFIPILCSGSLLYAKTHGYFAGNGLDVTLTPARGGAESKTCWFSATRMRRTCFRQCRWPSAKDWTVACAGVHLACIQNVNGQALTLARKHTGIREMLAR